MCTCVHVLLEVCSLFKTMRGAHSHWVLLHLISIGWVSATGWLWVWAVPVSVCLFGLTPSASEPCVGVTLPSRPCLPEVDPPHSPTLKVTLLNTNSAFHFPSFLLDLSVFSVPYTNTYTHAHCHSLHLCPVCPLCFWLLTTFSWRNKPHALCRCAPVLWMSLYVFNSYSPLYMCLWFDSIVSI